MLTRRQADIPPEMIGAYCIVPWMRRTCGADAPTRLPDWREQRIRELSEAYAKPAEHNGNGNGHAHDKRRSHNGKRRLGGHALPMFDVEGVSALLTIHRGDREQIARVLGKPAYKVVRFMRQHGLLAQWKRPTGPPKGYTPMLRHGEHARLLRVASPNGLVHTLRPGRARLTNCGTVTAANWSRTKKAATCKQCLSAHVRRTKGK